MSDNFGIKISTPNTDVNSSDASQLLMSSSYPFLKIDTQSDVAYQTLLLLFSNDPPAAAFGTTQTTGVYSFAHGYKYVPKVWALFTTVVQATSPETPQQYFLDNGLIAQQLPGQDATYMYIGADSTNVYIYVAKSDFGGGNSNLIGASYKITTFTFVDDLT